MSADIATQIEAQGTQPDNFTMLPNMALIDLSATAYKLLAIYLDTAKTNQVYAKNSTLSKKLGVTANTMKKARKELADKGYIIFASGKDGADTTTARVVIQINWMWTENHKRMSKSDTTTQETDVRVSNIDTMLSNSDTPLSNSDTNNQYLKNKELKKEDDLASQLDQIEALLDGIEMFKGSRYKDRLIFHSDFEDYPFADWLAGFDIFKQEIARKIAEQGDKYTPLPYKYLEQCVSGVGVKRTQVAIVEADKPQVRFVASAPIERPRVDDMIVFDKKLGEGA